MKENLESKKGFASQLTLECSAQNCHYSRSFYTSGTEHNGKAFEVNRTAVLAGRNIDIGQTRLTKFAGTMNMPPNKCECIWGSCFCYKYCCWAGL